MRRSQQSIVANPVLVGAVTVLVTVVAVFLAYNANNGLPFVPTRELTIEMSNGANLVRGNEVRIGGYRVGVVEEMVPGRISDGTVGAILRLKLDRSVGAVPVDSTAKIRPRSSLGLKYVELTRGESPRTLPDGGRLTAASTSVPVELDEFYNIFDEETRKNSQTALEGFGNAFAFRGPDLNDTIAEAPRLFGALRPVMANLADPQTDLPSFFSELGDAARIVAPVAKQQSQLFTDMADTFEALSRDENALEQTIAKSPETLRVGTRSLKVQGPFLRDTADLSTDLRGATRELRAALPPLNEAVETGTPVLRRSVELNDDLRDALAALERLATEPLTNAALRGLTTTVNTLNPIIRYIGPHITVCDWLGAWPTFVSEHFQQPDVTGESQRALLNTTGDTVDGIGDNDANEPANGVQDPPFRGIPEHLHAQPYAAAVDAQGRADCEVGQRGYPRRLASDPRVKPNENIVVDPRTPGLQGPVWKFWRNGKPTGELGPTRVPAGQTFSHAPETTPSRIP